MKNKWKLLLLFGLISFNTACYKLLSVPESDDLNSVAPTNIYPLDGAVDVSLVNYNELILEWDYDGYMKGNVHYIIYISPSVDFEDAYINSVRFQQFEVRLDRRTTYFWKIEAKYEDFSVSSEVWRFTTY